MKQNIFNNENKNKIDISDLTDEIAKLKHFLISSNKDKSHRATLSDKIRFR